MCGVCVCIYRYIYKKGDSLTKKTSKMFCVCVCWILLCVFFLLFFSTKKQTLFLFCVCVCVCVVALFRFNSYLSPLCSLCLPRTVHSIFALLLVIVVVVVVVVIVVCLCVCVCVFPGVLEVSLLLLSVVACLGHRCAF